MPTFAMSGALAWQVTKVLIKDPIFGVWREGDRTGNIFFSRVLPPSCVCCVRFSSRLFYRSSDVLLQASAPGFCRTRIFDGVGSTMISLTNSRSSVPTSFAIESSGSTTSNDTSQVERLFEHERNNLLLSLFFQKTERLLSSTQQNKLTFPTLKQTYLILKQSNYMKCFSHEQVTAEN